MQLTTNVPFINDGYYRVWPTCGLWGLKAGGYLKASLHQRRINASRSEFNSVRMKPSRLLITSAQEEFTGTLGSSVYSHSTHAGAHTQIKNRISRFKIRFKLYSLSVFQLKSFEAFEGGTLYSGPRGWVSVLCRSLDERGALPWAFSYGNTLLLLLLLLLCNTVTLWSQPSAEWERRKQAQILLLFSHLFLYFYFQVAVKGPNQKGLL